MVIDRIEGAQAVVECGKGAFVNVPLDKIEGRVRDGAVLESANGCYRVNELATARRQEIVAAKRNAFFKK